MKITKSQLKTMVREVFQDLKEKDTPKLQRWEVYIDGEKKPFVVSGKNQKAAKKIAHAMTYPAKIKIKKIRKVN